MATVAKPPAIPKAKRKSIAPDLYERMLAGGSILLLVAVAAAIARGASQWASVPAMVWVHLATIMLFAAAAEQKRLDRPGTLDDPGEPHRADIEEGADSGEQEDGGDGELDHLGHGGDCGFR